MLILIFVKRSLKMKTKIRLTIFILLVFFCYGLSHADSGWIYNPDTGHWYQRIDTNMTWHDAKAYAESLGGYLVTITSQSENDFIYNNLVSGINEIIWLGGTDEEQEGIWKWVTGEIFYDHNTKECLLYCNWYPGEPNDAWGGQDYLTFHPDFGNAWDDDGPPYYNHSFKFIVEVVPEPISSILFITGGATLIGRYYFKRKKV
jgi:hypothetical protein